MLSLNDRGIVVEKDWSWPVNIVQMCDDAKSLFWMVWCAGKDGDRPCGCQPTPPVGIGATETEALETWRFVHFEKRYQGRRR